MKHLKLYKDLDEDFKVGDQVVFTYLDENDDPTFKYDTVYTIHKNIHKNAYICYIINEKGVGDYFQKKDIRKATSEEIAANKYNL